MLATLLLRTLKRLSIFLGVLASLACLLSLALNGPSQPLVIHNELKTVDLSTYESIRVMSLNLAHGRASGAHQSMQTRAKIQANLKAVSAIIDEHEPDLVALQEADGESRWSGSFNHVGQLGSQADMAWIHGHHVEGLGVRYGSALLSRFTLDQAASVTFPVSPPSFAKGYVVAALNGHEVDIVSVHLDETQGWLRQRQLDRMIDSLGERGRRMVVMGDFNGDFANEDSLLQSLCDALDLSAHEPEGGAATEEYSGKRNDWILISKGMRFTSYEVLGSGLSDHRPVLAEIELGR